eukprot:CAMPEP_0179309778 /NCGR_PEP_ID=MMETSP0797-20121207/51826_1 /TAXON_ID=47934 /ORGANISM="Dinophysis acuminata, Strain DAEP01" /LENGTH=119 /DNA_ID=CAMNT_0021019491 /DNA_START=12 /DNA_END=367 /DNA_ORIENTATION=-
MLPDTTPPGTGLSYSGSTGREGGRRLSVLSMPSPCRALWRASIGDETFLDSPNKDKEESALMTSRLGSIIQHESGRFSFLSPHGGGASMLMMSPPSRAPACAPFDSPERSPEPDTAGRG